MTKTTNKSNTTNEFIFFQIRSQQITRQRALESSQHKRNDEKGLKYLALRRPARSRAVNTRVRGPVSLVARPSVQITTRQARFTRQVNISPGSAAASAFPSAPESRSGGAGIANPEFAPAELTSPRYLPSASGSGFKNNHFAEI